MDTMALILGLAGIVGTLAGALSANGVTLLIERRKDRQEEGRARGEVRKAARLVATELQEAMGAVATALNSRTLWLAEFAPSRVAWLEYSPLLATTLTTAEYKQVSRAYVQLKNDLAIASSSSDRRLADPYVEGLALTKDALDEACAALDRLTALE